MLLFRRLCVSALILSLAAACAPSFQPARFKGTNEQLYEASRREYQRRKWDNAVAGFERLTLELPARDTLLPLAHYYLGRAHGRRGEHLLAAQSFARLAESFPDDTLADDAMYEAARAYQRLWRRPDLDAEYGQLATATYQTLIAVYPDSPMADDARREIARLEQWFATKDYENGMHYLRRKAYDSAIIYFRDVVSNYPNTPRARDARLRLVEAFRAIRYKEDVEEVCSALRQNYPGDREVRQECGQGPVARDTTPAPVP